MKSIVTFKGEEILVDDEDFDRVSAFAWRIGTRGYACRKIYAGDRRRWVMLHRFILGIPNDDPRIVDHANGIKTDNRRSNLRICSKSQNGYNQPQQRNNTTGLKGVTLHRGTGRFMAQIRSNGQKKYLGVFDTPQEAHAAYCAAAIELHGNFANPGLIDAALTAAQSASGDTK